MIYNIYTTSACITLSHAKYLFQTRFKFFSHDIHQEIFYCLWSKPFLVYKTRKSFSWNSYSNTFAAICFSFSLSLCLSLVLSLDICYLIMQWKKRRWGLPTNKIRSSNLFSPCCSSAWSVFCNYFRTNNNEINLPDLVQEILKKILFFR